VKIPGLDHPITIEAATERVTVRVGGRVIAESSAALVLREAHLRPVYYIPIADVDRSAIVESASHTYCPFKGTASYFSLKNGPANSVWTYEQPYDEMLAIKELLAFYPDKVEIVAEAKR